MSYIGPPQSPVKQTSPTKAVVTMTNKFEMSPMQKMYASQKQLDYVMRELERFHQFVQREVLPSQMAASNSSDQALADMRLAHARQLYADYYLLLKEYVAHGGNPAPYELKGADLYFESAAYLIARERRASMAQQATPKSDMPSHSQFVRDHFNEFNHLEMDKSVKQPKGIISKDTSCDIIQEWRAELS
uniref:Uncharacterized protein n=1 Tax=Trichogramma kaykai TaxID=54128 RepID=A0ABD2XCZ4_9HYME